MNMYIINYQVDDRNFRPHRGCVSARLQARVVEAVTVCASESDIWQEATCAFVMIRPIISFESDAYPCIEAANPGFLEVPVLLCFIHKSSICTAHSIETFRGGEGVEICKITVNLIEDCLNQNSYGYLVDFYRKITFM